MRKVAALSRMSKVTGRIRKVSSNSIRASQAPKSRCEIGKGPSSYNSISRASRSFPRSSNLPVGRREMRIVQKVCRLQPLYAISVRKVLKLACSSVYLSREFSHSLQSISYRKNISKIYRKIIKFVCIFFFIFILIISNDDIHSDYFHIEIFILIIFYLESHKDFNPS